jgi:hypothetical protein
MYRICSARTDIKFNTACEYFRLSAMKYTEVVPVLSNSKNSVFYLNVLFHLQSRFSLIYKAVFAFVRKTIANS